tara:strand:- start:542 stop:1123 length:582 start_codon:yes stop_codon:yes gene_type:complete
MTDLYCPVTLVDQLKNTPAHSGPILRLMTTIAGKKGLPFDHTHQYQCFRPGVSSTSLDKLGLKESKKRRINLFEKIRYQRLDLLHCPKLSPQAATEQSIYDAKVFVEKESNRIFEICLLHLARSRLKNRDNLPLDIGNQRNQQRIPSPKVVLECTQLHTTRPRECSHAETAVPPHRQLAQSPLAKSQFFDQQP